MSEERAYHQDVGRVGAIGQEIAVCHAVSIPSSISRRAEIGAIIPLLTSVCGWRYQRRGVKEVYSKADQRGKQKFLEVLVKEIVLQKDPVVVWQEPFDMLFTLGEVFREKRIWGETLHRFVNTIWHFDFGFRIDRLAELNQIYLIL